MKKFKKKLILTITLLSTLPLKTTPLCNHLCKECEGEKCIVCKKGHGLTEGACYSCLIEKCEDCSGDPKKCVSCRSYHYYQDQLEECRRCGFGCKECQTEKSCEKCGFIFKKKNSNHGECRISAFLLIVILVALIAPCVFVWTLTYCICLKSRPKYDENGNVVIPNIRRTEKRFTGRQEKLPFKKRIQNFLFVYGDNGKGGGKEEEEERGAGEDKGGEESGGVLVSETAR